MAGNKFFGVDVAKVVRDATRGQLLEATLIKKSVGDRTAGDLTSGKVKTWTSHPCEGFTSSFKDSQIDGTVVKKGDRKVTLIGESIEGGAVPEPGDKITIEGETREIVKGGVTRDPAKAAYTCHCR